MPKNSKKSKSKSGASKQQDNSLKALNYMIKKGYIEKTADLSKKGSRSAAIKELIEIYASTYPDMFGRGSAHQRITAHYTEKGSARGISAVIDSLMDEGKLLESDLSYSQETDPLLKSLESLQTKAQGQSALGMLNNTQIGGVMSYSEGMFKQYGKEFGENYSIQQMLDQNLFAPARFNLRHMFDEIKNESDRLTNNLRFGSGALSASIQSKANELQILVVKFVTGLRVAGLPADVVIENNDKTVELSDLIAMSVEGRDSLKLFLGALNILTSMTGTFARPTKGHFRKLRDDLALDQSRYGMDLRESVHEGTNIVPRDGLYSSLSIVGSNISRLFQEGVIDKAGYKELKGEFDKLVIRAKKTPTLGDLAKMRLDNPKRYSEAKYTYDKLSLSIVIFGKKVDTKATVKVLVEQLTKLEATKKTLLSKAQNILDVASKMNKAPKETLQALSKDDRTKAIKALQIIRQATGMLRSAKSDKEARAIFANFLLNADIKSGLGIVIRLGREADFVSFKDVVKAQNSGFSKVQDGKYQQSQTLAMFYVDPSGTIGRPPFKGLRGPTSKKINALGGKLVKVISDIGGSALISKAELGAPVGNDPRLVLKSLPASARSLSSDHAKARSLAGARFLSMLKNKLSIVSGYAPAAFGAAVVNEGTSSIYLNQIKAFKDILLSAKYDAGLRNTQISFKNGLHLCGFSEEQQEWNASQSKVPLAIIAPFDLLWFPIFRGNTLYPQSSPMRTKTWEFAGKQKGLSQSEDGQSYLARRHSMNELGEDELYNWNPIQAEDLRHRYFVSLYPFSLSGEFKKLYDEELAKIKKIDLISDDVDAFAFLDSLNLGFDI